MDVGGEEEESINTHFSNSGLSAEINNKQKGTLKKNLPLCLIFEMFQIVESYMKENELNGNKC